MAWIRTRKGSDGKTRYQAIVNVRGRRPVYQTFSTKKVAKEWATRIEAEALAGRLLPRQEAERHTLEEMAKLYLEEQAPSLSTGEARNRKRQLEWWVEEPASCSASSSGARGTGTRLEPAAMPALAPTPRRSVTTLGGWPLAEIDFAAWKKATPIHSPWQP